MNQDHEWLKLQVGAGLQKLLCLGLDRTPASELMTGTVSAWVEALGHNHVWEQERDTPRIKTAFACLLKTSTQWPQPKHLLDALPPYVAPRALRREIKVTPETIELMKTMELLLKASQ